MSIMPLEEHAQEGWHRCHSISLLSLFRLPLSADYHRRRANPAAPIGLPPCAARFLPLPLALLLRRRAPTLPSPGKPTGEHPGTSLLLPHALARADLASNRVFVVANRCRRSPSSPAELQPPMPPARSPIDAP
uniref:Uncharacterized protein n=1 Tax=Leersia perrieri TaxID=77586 RepID=A0A0D9X2B8_9ORYZ